MSPREALDEKVPKAKICTQRKSQTRDEDLHNMKVPEERSAR
jgi:hypothetical protein